ncbi:PIN domain-containing protein [Modestobacter sp. KNN46-3]|uniref:PIN domain-containing protein n=1 Tax=Modestobacter sp. KNN46-3 TaxID=2711218 RepID=UPI0013DF4FD8|nr:PIN domain-containing protein [Modestobacter sp. KNN46-3]
MTAPVLLDACVLVPQRLSSLLLTLAEEGLFEPRWSDHILAETERALVDKLRLPRDRAVRRLDAMREAFPEAAVYGFEPLQNGLTCHPKDRHVLAAAIAASAETLVTANVKDFPEASCQPHGITVSDPDLFLLELMVRDGRACQTAVQREARRMRRPPMTTRDVLAGVAGVVPTFANSLHQAMLDGVFASSDVPAYETVPAEVSPLQAYADDFDLTDPLQVALAWWHALDDRDRYLAALHNLTWSPAAFGDYVWAEELLAGWSIASRVYYAVDDPAGDVAFVRFVPEVAQSSQVFESFVVRGARFMTMKRRPDGAWCVWGLGGRMIGARPVRDG